MKITHERLKEIIDTNESVKSGSWRWGRTEQYVFKEGDKFYSVFARFHVEDGLQDDGSQAAVEVKPVERTVVDWVRA